MEKVKLDIKRLTPLKALRAKCLDCSNKQPSEVRKCPIADCPLFIYRFGHNPERRGIGCRAGNEAVELPA